MVIVTFLLDFLCIGGVAQESVRMLEYVRSLDHLDRLNETKMGHAVKYGE